MCEIEGSYRGYNRLYKNLFKELYEWLGTISYNGTSFASNRYYKVKILGSIDEYLARFREEITIGPDTTTEEAESEFFEVLWVHIRDLIDQVNDIMIDSEDVLNSYENNFGYYFDKYKCHNVDELVSLVRSDIDEADCIVKKAKILLAEIEPLRPKDGPFSRSQL